jgi:formamidopyrimidine-DNA glycosylase
MPELPEVETIVKGLAKKVLGRTFVDSWTDFPKNIKKPESVMKFRAGLKNEKIKKIWRRGKNILIGLSDNKVLLVHQKMTGHLLYGKWKKENGKWVSEIPGALACDPRNGFLHLVLFLDNGFQIALSDLRKFAKIELTTKKDLEDPKELGDLGIEPFDKKFTFNKFAEILPKKGRIKQILMDQTVIAGIGNIYSDEILWDAKIHPLRDVSKISASELKKIYRAIFKILGKAILFKGDSFNDFRMIDGKKGGYQNLHLVYGRERKMCYRKDGGIIQRLKIGGRSAHFCPVCQI